MPKLYFVPGIMGSRLYQRGKPGFTVWVDSDVLFYGVGPVALADDGISPRADDGMLLDPGEPLGEVDPKFFQQPRAIYGPFLQRIRTGLGLDEFEVVPFGYDWRLKNQFAGESLAFKIRNDVSAADPCTIIAHSQGGLVSRVAWAELSKSGDSGLVRRIITIGTPHRGSYSPLEAWSLDDEMIDMFMAGYEKNPGNTVTEIDIANVAATWPSMYELLPLLDAKAQAEDPNRAGAFNRATYSNQINVKQSWFNHARYTWQPFLRSPSSIPPYDVMTTVAGRGRSTPYLRLPRRVGFHTMNCLETDEGDMRVPVDSALLPAPASRTYVYAGSHNDVFLHPDFLAELPNMIREERSLPAEPTVVSPVGATPIQAGPPYFGLPQGAYDC